MTDAPTLKPCPFCGAEARTTTEYLEYSGEWQQIAQCTDCGASIRDDDRDDVVAQWDRRVSRDGIQEAKGAEQPSAVVGFGIGEQAAFFRLIDAAETAKRVKGPSAAGNSNGGSSPPRPDSAAAALWDAYRAAHARVRVEALVSNVAYAQACDAEGIENPTVLQSTRISIEHPEECAAFAAAEAEAEIARLRAAQYEHAQWTGEAIARALAQSAREVGT